MKIISNYRKKYYLKQYFTSKDKDASIDVILSYKYSHIFQNNIPRERIIEREIISY
ncbi:hypothetical protein [Brassicibacter mesophilus]|uniref:hypothetical protein n=1 Tax=Brassicibacter mesophilus TaxID=745119 RepID=UPI003D22AAC2